MKRFIITVFILISSFLFAEERQRGSISGQVLDMKSGEPLVGVNISVRNTNWGSVTDLDGFYKIPKLSPSSYNLDFSMIGYEKVIKLNVEVHPGNQTNLNVEMNQSVLEMKGIKVIAPAFQKPKGAVLSENSIDLGEIRNDPASYDVQRAVQVLPSVSGSSDGINELIVRGGYPGENLFVMDDIEIPNPNHFAMPGSGGGPINLINNEFISNVDFYAGAFPAQYGDKASSVMDVKFREGSSESMQGTIDMGMSGIGGLLEGPIKNKGSYLFSAHKSYLELIVGSLGLTAIPYYWNTQGKIVYNLTNRQKLIVNGIYGNDHIKITGEDGAWSRGAEYVNCRDYTYAYGATLRSLLGKNSFSKLTVYQNQGNVDYDVDRYEEEDVRRDWVDQKATETESAVKFTYSKTLSPKTDFQLGGQVKHVKMDFYSKFYGDTLFGRINNVIVDTVEINDPELNDDISKSIKSMAFFSMTIHPMHRLKMIAGLRANHYSISDETTVAPRLGLSYTINTKTSLNLAFGRHYQIPSYFMIMENGEGEPTLKTKYTNQYVAGLEYYPKEDIKISAEVFIKKYSRVPIENNWITPDTTDDFDYYVNKGKMRAKGFEFYFHKKLFDNWYGIVSYSYSKTEANDPRYWEWYPGDYDYQQIFNAVGSYRIRKNKKWNNLFLKIITTNSDEFSISFHYRYMGGRPYTKREYNPYLERWYIPRESRLNTERYPTYQRFDISFRWREEFKKIHFVSYFTIENLFDKKNIWEYVYAADGTIDKEYQYSRMLVGGFILEF